MAATHIQAVVEHSTFGDSLTMRAELAQLRGVSKHRFKLLSLPLPSALSPQSKSLGSAEQDILSPAPHKAKDHEDLYDEGVNSLHQAAEAPVNRRIRSHKKNKSIAGGEVILGGLALTFAISVCCYLRVTRRKDGEIGAEKDPDRSSSFSMSLSPSERDLEKDGKKDGDKDIGKDGDSNVARGVKGIENIER
ncbi:hypothetical protein FRX31_026643 [Thalictrum thalictroides]|uniref:Transmembrane protein n=1 Tax=Thalictrum thalictroides TaxID=46969 RepID=A0A7J6VG68_THATH|nr:hypothetical protein FRX31_026643 [Thalictrum thalictroides]